jgi:hypothetical protein
VLTSRGEGAEWKGSGKSWVEEVDEEGDGGGGGWEEKWKGRRLLRVALRGHHL